MQNAPLSKSEKLLASARIQGNMDFPDAATQMRRLSGPCGGAAHQDVLVAADVDVSSEKEKGGEEEWGQRREKKSENKVRKSKRGQQTDRYSQSLLHVQQQVPPGAEISL